jgi:ABC-type branched-subunit amino acid transport system substrate-binding protein
VPRCTPTRRLLLVLFCVSALTTAGATAGAASTTGAPRTGAPVTVMTMGDFETAGSNNFVWAQAAQARFADINGSGGVRDVRGRRHRVKVIVCDTQLDPSRAARCARRAVEQKVAAIVGLSVIDSDQVWPVLEPAGIAGIGTRINSVSDATSAVSFPLAAGLPGVLMGLPQVLARQGAIKIGVVISEFGTATDGALGFLRRGLALTRAGEGPIVRVSRAGTDLSRAAQEVTRDGVDGVIGFVVGGDEGALIRRLRESGFKGRYATPASFGVNPLASAAADSTEGALVVGEFAPLFSPGPGAHEFRQDMAVYTSASAKSDDEGAINYWLAARVFERVAARLDRIDAPSMLAALRQTKGLDMGGLTPPLDATRDDSELPRLLNRTVTFSRIRNGLLVPVRTGFFDPFAGRFVSTRAAG